MVLMSLLVDVLSFLVGTVGSITLAIRAKVVFQSPMRHWARAFPPQAVADVAVLGNGRSLVHWNECIHPSCSTIGFNFIGLHVNVPEYYFIEMPLEDDRRAQLLELISRRGDRLATKAVFIKDTWVASRQNRTAREFVRRVRLACGNKVHFVPGVSIRGLYKDNAAPMWLSRLARINRIIATHLIAKEPVVQMGSSVAAVVEILARHKFSRIVFLGVDLCTPGYFYDNPRIVRKTLRDLIPENIQSGAIHRTARCDAEIDLPNALRAIHIMYAQKFECINSNSMLLRSRVCVPSQGRR